jgi:hypothetical protein
MKLFSSSSAIFFLSLLCGYSCLEEKQKTHDHYSNSSAGKKSHYQHHRPKDDRMNNGKKAAIAALKAVSSEECDWKLNPISLIRGDPCGRYYKILGLTRHAADLPTIKKKYREQSKILHPDKNPSKEAQDAFTSLTEGYSCLVDENCRSDYDNILRQMEENITVRRIQKIQLASFKLKEIVAKMHYHISYMATSIDQGKKKLPISYLKVQPILIFAFVVVVVTVVVVTTYYVQLQHLHGKNSEL